jgi:hypothetical protein
MPSVTGFASAVINYALNAPAVGTNFPLSIDGSAVTSGTVSASNLPVASATTDGIVTTGSQVFAGNKNFSSTPVLLTGSLELGLGRDADGPAFVDFTSQTGAIDNNARIIRNSGANGTLQILQGGTGEVQINQSINMTGGIGIKYQGISGTNFVGFKWTSPNIIGRIDNSVDVTLANVSDYRIKRNIETQETPALERIAQLRPVTYQMADYGELFKASEEVHEGFIAHELQEVVPSAVHGVKDDPNQIQSLKLDALVAVLTKAIQEQQAIIDELGNRIKALES